MPSWKRIIVGDAFKLPDKNPRFYVDVVLVFPIVLGLLALSRPIWASTHSEWSGREVVIGAVALLACFLVAKERAVTFAAAFGYMFFVGLLNLPLAPSSQQLWLMLAMILLAGTSTLAIVILNAKRTEFYRSTNPLTDRVIAAVAAGCAFILVLWKLGGVFQFYRLYFRPH